VYGATGYKLTTEGSRKCGCGTEGNPQKAFETKRGPIRVMKGRGGKRGKRKEQRL